LPEDVDGFCRRHGIDRERFVFYSIGAWNARKAPWDLINAYLLAFEKRQPVLLVIKTDAAGPSHPGDPGMSPTRQQLEALRARIPDAPEIVLIDEPLEERDIELLHAAGDVYVSLTRSEGWGLGMFDAAALGKPVICTGWGGQLDYLRQEYSTLLDYTLRPVMDRRGHRSYAPYQNWAHASLDCAIEALREHFGNPAPGVAAAKEQAAWIRERFSPKVVGDRLLAASSA
jgi:glycosyltransferase involved in cell wall biosynthesis